VISLLYEALISLYSPLDALKQEIRTVVLSAGDFEDDIYCELGTVSLLDPNRSSYEALSYAWGEARPVRKIFINGKRCSITGNLESALRHLRYKDKPRRLWVDAICINQADVDERNAQVKAMGAVYKSATQVLAFLGPEYDDSDLAFDYFNTMPKDTALHLDPKEHPSLASVYTRPHIDAVNALFARTWWHRVWTVQESVLCEALLFVCGRKELLAEQAFGVANGYFKHVYGCCQPLWHSILDPAAGLGDSCDALAKLEEMRAHEHEYTFPQILSKFMFRHSSDAQDKIYGLLGLASKQEALLVAPDYSKPAADVYREATYRFMEETGELVFLSVQFPKTMERSDSSEVFAGLPSWVPNWALNADPTLLYDLDNRFSCLSKFSASGGSRALVTMSPQGHLAVRGLTVSKIATLSPDIHHWDEADDLFAFFDGWRDMVGIKSEPDRLYPKSQTTTYSDAFWQILCCSIIPDRVHPRDVNLAQRTSDASPHKLWFDAWWIWCEEYNCDGPKLPLVQSPTYSEAEINSMGGLISTSISMRRLMVADDGRIGLAPMDAQVGDSVVLLEGGRVPYILRQSRQDSKSMYDLVGDAYVHGIMDGEEWTGEDLVDIKLV
jgi:hypothetical protein